MPARHDMIAVFVVRPDESGRSHEFLQLHRVPHDYLGNTWQIIRGGVEAGETHVQAALREMQEEAGLAPRQFYRLGLLESFYTECDNTLWQVAPFCAVVDRQQEIRLNHEHDAFRWISRQKMDEHIMWASERQLLSALCRDILDDGPAKEHLRVPLPRLP